MGKSSNLQPCLITEGVAAERKRNVKLKSDNSFAANSSEHLFGTDHLQSLVKWHLPEALCDILTSVIAGRIMIFKGQFIPVCVWRTHDY